MTVTSFAIGAALVALAIGGYRFYRQLQEMGKALSRLT